MHGLTQDFLWAERVGQGEVGEWVPPKGETAQLCLGLAIKSPQSELGGLLLLFYTCTVRVTVGLLEESFSFAWSLHVPSLSFHVTSPPRFGLVWLDDYISSSKQKRKTNLEPELWRVCSIDQKSHPLLVIYTYETHQGMLSSEYWLPTVVSMHRHIGTEWSWDDLQEASLP